MAASAPVVGVDRRGYVQPMHGRTSSLVHSYRRLPPGIRDRFRWLRRPLLHFTKAVVARASRGRVVSGPFRGMSWPGRARIPRYLLGTQELELAQLFEDVIRSKPDVIVNVGSADGYYTVGLARRLPDARVIGFEADAAAARRGAEVAAANDLTERLEARGLCTAQELDKALGGATSPFVIVDIEGGEVDVLDLSRAPSLSRATILVETHDLLRPGCADTIRRRFAASHRIETVRTRLRTLSDFPSGFVPWLPRLAPRTCLGLLQEERGGDQEWLILIPSRLATG